MSQQRITLFFPRISSKRTQSTARCRFLEIPYKIRLRIYYEAGLVTGTVVDLNVWASDKQEGLYRRTFYPWDHSFSPPLSLFPACRLVYEELVHALYGKNRFIIRRTSPHSLRALERQSNATLRQLRCLIIHLNVASCENRCCIPRSKCGNGNSIERCKPSTHDVALDCGSDSGRIIIDQWHRICRFLADKIEPGQLALYVICDSANRETAEMIIQPLLELPILRDFGIRLALDARPDLQSFARDTAFRMTATPIPPPSSPFPFFQLPKEIQLKILSHTALVYHGEHMEVLCSQQRRRYGGWCEAGGRVCQETNYDRYSHSRLKCFCSTSHSAFNFQCQDEDIGFPFAMFLVSHEFKEAATEILYGQNPFVLKMQGLIPSSIPSVVSIMGSEYTMQSQMASILPPVLLRFPLGSIQFITSLALEFEYSNLDCLQPDHDGWVHWLDTISILSREANLSILTLELRFSEKSFPSPWESKVEYGLEYRTSTLETYTRFLAPMLRLEGLRNLFVHLNWGSSNPVDDGRWFYEQRLEESIMGETYNAWERGKQLCSLDYGCPGHPT